MGRGESRRRHTENVLGSRENLALKGMGWAFGIKGGKTVSQDEEERTLDKLFRRVVLPFTKNHQRPGEI